MEDESPAQGPQEAGETDRTLLTLAVGDIFGETGTQKQRWGRTHERRNALNHEAKISEL